jgi:hypothetical protein
MLHVLRACSATSYRRRTAAKARIRRIVFRAVDARIHDDPTKASARRLPSSIPLRDLPGQVLSESTQLADSFVHGRQVSSSQLEHVRARSGAFAAQFQNLGDLLERESEALSFLDETEFFEIRFGVSPVACRGTCRPRQQPDALVVSDRRCTQTGTFGDIANQQVPHRSSTKPQVHLRVKRVDSQVGFSRYARRVTDGPPHRSRGMHHEDEASRVGCNADWVVQCECRCCDQNGSERRLLSVLSIENEVWGAAFAALPSCARLS